MTKTEALAARVAMLEQAIRDANGYFENLCSFRDSRESWCYSVDEVTGKILTPALKGKQPNLSDETLAEIRGIEEEDPLAPPMISKSEKDRINKEWKAIFGKTLARRRLSC